MADQQLQQAIDVLVERVQRKEKELADMRRLVNSLCAEAGLDARYATVEEESAGVGSLRPDEYYGKSPITAAREYLERKGGAATVEEITNALERGGFNFETQGWGKKENRTRNLAISMSKNSIIFHRLPNGYYGLVKFYPDVEAEKKQKKVGVAENGSAEEKPKTDDEKGASAH